MKKIIASLLLMAIGATAFAQAPAPPQGPPPRDHKTPEQRATDQANHLEKELGLSADQKTKVHDLALAREQKMEKLRERKDTTGVHAERKKIMDEFHDGMKKTLTPEQFKKWEDMKKQHRGDRPQPPSPEQKAKGFADHLEKDLGLNADQKMKVQDLALAKEQKMSDLRKQQPHDQAWTEKRKQAHKEFKDGMKKTLTPEQYQKWEAQQKARREQQKAKKSCEKKELKQEEKGK